MDDESALLDTIAAAPEDDLPRLVYADWLEDRGDAPRAAFIRAHVELARTPLGAPEFTRLVVAASESFRAHYAGWLAGLVLPGEDPWPAAWRPRLGGVFSSRHPWHLDNPGGHSLFRGTAFDCFRAGSRRPAARQVLVFRGLVERVVVTNRPVDLSRHPVTDLRVRVGPPGPVGFPLDQPALGRVHSLTLDCAEPPARGLCHGAADSGHWRGLRSLAVRGASADHVGPALAAAAVGRVAGLVRTLEVSADVTAAFAALADWPAGRLDELRLRGTVPTWRLSDWPLARTLRTLDLADCRFIGIGVGGLTDGRPWDRLTTLELSGFRDARPAGLAELAHTALFPAVIALSLQNTAFTDAAADAFAESSWPARLRVLDVSMTPVTPAGLLPLARALRDGPLERLRLTLDRPHCPDVRRLRDLLGPRLVRDWD